jgi:hypothetical protein
VWPAAARAFTQSKSGSSRCPNYSHSDQPHGLVFGVSDYGHEVLGSIPGSTMGIFP